VVGDGRAFGQNRQSARVEDTNEVANGLLARVQLLGDGCGGACCGTGKQDLAASNGEGICRPQPGFERVTLLVGDEYTITYTILPEFALARRQEGLSRVWAAGSD
jgi:hypothetical protein